MSRDDVVAAAAHEFATRGYHATSIEHLLTATGLTRGGLYHYIDGKADLLIAVQLELLQPLLEQAHAAVAATEDPERQLREVTRLWVEHAASHRDHMVVFAAERRLVESDPRWAEIHRAREEFEQLLAGIFARGRFGDRIAELAFLGMVNHMPTWFDPHGRLTGAEVAERFCDVLLDGVRTRRHR